MAHVGRPPKPAEQRRRLGEPGHSNPLPAVRDVVPLAPLSGDVPAHLGPDGAELWLSVREAARAWLAPSDALTLLMLCELYDRRAEYKKVLTDYGPVIMRPDGHLVANPIAQQLIQTEKMITEIAASLGLTPADRTRMGLAEVKAANEFAQMMDRRRVADRA